MLGVAYEAPSLATGYGAYLAQVSSRSRGKGKGNGLVLVYFLSWNSEEGQAGILMLGSWCFVSGD
jgi:hypothetical protein